MKRNTPDNKESSAYLFITGLCMGTADLVPGVSGGTVALLFGIYKKLLHNITIVTGQVPKYILKGNFKRAYRIFPFSFILPLFFGILVAIFSLVSLITFLLENYPVYIWSLFFGLVLGSAYVVSKSIKWEPRLVVLTLFSALLTFILLGISPLSGSESNLAFFITGMFAVIAMILPGISGSLIMVILGQYKNVINAVAERNYEAMIIFASGAFVGLALFSHLLKWLLQHYYRFVIAVLVGLMLGSLRKVWPWQEELVTGETTNYIPQASSTLFLAFLIFVIGLVLVLKLEKRSLAKNKGRAL